MIRQAGKISALIVAMAILSACLPVFAQPLACPPSRSTIVTLGKDTAFCNGTCTILKPKHLSTEMKSTKTYTTGTTQYLPYPYNSGTQVLTKQDDIWSGKIDLPFDFCFFGKKYNKCVIGANGNMSFDVSLAGVLQSYWVYPAPYNGPCYNNCIMGPFYDINPKLGGEIRYATYGVAPCRTFVVSWNEIPLYDCTSLTGSHQIVLYESTYAIDVFIKLRPICYTWQGGKGVLGVQNDDATMAYILPGKNCTAWYDSAAGYRFTPNALPDVSYKWINAGTGSLIASTDSILVCPSDTTTYVFEATYTSQCDIITMADTIRINILNIPSSSDYSYDIRYGCREDTVLFKNLSVYGASLPPGKERYHWDFGDGKTDTAKNPAHVFKSQGSYTVVLTTKGDGVCEDTSSKVINISHVLKAGFKVDKDSFCGQGTVSFVDTSSVTSLYGNPTSYKWIFADGGISFLKHPVYTYNQPGVFLVKQIVGNAVPCYDTAYKIIVVDSIPYVAFTVSDSELCAGGSVVFKGDYRKNGFKSLVWDFGDGDMSYGNNIVTHGYDTIGLIKVKLTAKYNICPDTTAYHTIRIKPYPFLDLGKDTAICPGASQMWLADTAKYESQKVFRVWNTDDTTTGIWVHHPGRYHVKVSVDGCVTSDTINIDKNCFINIPNSFSPNGDGENDNFFPLPLLSGGIVSYKMYVFNRWGQVVYESKRTDGYGWDGNMNGVPQPFGVYVYMIDVVFQNDIKEHYHGNVTLLR